MQAVRELLPQSLWKAMEKELGREEALRLLWPAIVGRTLAAQTKLQRIVNDGRGGTLVISVPDGEYRGPIASLGKMILDRVHSFWGRPLAERIEFVVGPPPVAALETRSSPLETRDGNPNQAMAPGTRRGRRWEKVAT